MSVIGGLYLVFLAAAAGYVLIGRVPTLLHTPMLSGSNFIHGIVLAGAMLALSSASGPLELLIGFVGVTAASANVVGGFIVTDRMLNLFEQKGARTAEALGTDASASVDGNPSGRKRGSSGQSDDNDASRKSRSGTRGIK